MRMNTPARSLIGLALAIVTIGAGMTVVHGSTVAPRIAGDDPETVVVTFRPKAGAEEELARVIANHWATARRLELVRPEPHVTFRARDGVGKPYYVDIFTWRDADIPDNAPPAIQAIWADMNRLTESRDGRPGLDITPARLLAP
jgi:hypothetical protein